MQVTRGASTKVTLCLTAEGVSIFATKSTVGKYYYMLLCNGVQYGVGAMWMRRIHAIGVGVVLHSNRDGATAHIDGWAAGQEVGFIGGCKCIKHEPD